MVCIMHEIKTHLRDVSEGSDSYANKQLSDITSGWCFLVMLSSVMSAQQTAKIDLTYATNSHNSHHKLPGESPPMTPPFFHGQLAVCSANPTATVTHM